MAQGRQPHAVNYQPSMKTFKNSKNEGMFISQGFIEFAVTQKMVPSCRLLLFHVRDDKETVADSMLVDVEDTLENKVKVEFFLFNTVHYTSKNHCAIIGLFCLYSCQCILFYI